MEDGVTVPSGVAIRTTSGVYVGTAAELCGSASSVEVRAGVEDGVTVPPGVAVKITSGVDVGTAAELLAYGTAVKLTK